MRVEKQKHVSYVVRGAQLFRRFLRGESILVAEHRVNARSCRQAEVAVVICLRLQFLARQHTLQRVTTKVSAGCNFNYAELEHSNLKRKVSHKYT